MEVHLPQHQIQLRLCKIDIDDGKGQRMKREIPRRVPRKLPLIGHGDDVVIDHVSPFAIARGAILAGEGIAAVILDPRIQFE